MWIIIAAKLGYMLSLYLLFNPFLESMMELEQLSENIEKLLLRLKNYETQVADLKQRESKLQASNQALQTQIEQAQSKIQHIVSRLKSVETQA